MLEEVVELELRLNQDQLKALNDLLTHEGFIIYQELLEDLLSVELQNLEDCEDFEMFMWHKGRVKLLKQDILNLVKTQLEEEEDYGRE